VLGDAGRRRAARVALDEPNQLEQVLELAGDAGDDDKALRALARDVVWYLGEDPASRVDPSPTPESTLGLGAPVAAGRDGRAFLLAFTSRAALVAHHGAGEDASHVQVPAGALLALLPSALPVLLNASGPRQLVLEPRDVRTVMDLFEGRNAPAAFLPGPATGLLLAPLPAHAAHLPVRLRAAAHGLPDVHQLWAGAAVLDEPGARAYQVVVAQVPGDVDAVDLGPAMQALIAAAEAAGDDFTWVKPVRGQDADPMLAWLRENTPPLLAP
jgi:SseB protein N-terminal domain